MLMAVMPSRTAGVSSTVIALTIGGPSGINVPAQTPLPSQASFWVQSSPSSQVVFVATAVQVAVQQEFGWPLSAP